MNLNSKAKFRKLNLAKELWEKIANHLQNHEVSGYLITNYIEDTSTKKVDEKGLHTLMVSVSTLNTL